MEYTSAQNLASEFAYLPQASKLIRRLAQQGRCENRVLGMFESPPKFCLADILA